MKSIYFVRHGESEWNVANKICGATDIPLTAKGHEQAITGIPAVEELALIEQNFGKYEGTPRHNEEYAKFGVDNCTVTEFIYK